MHRASVTALGEETALEAKAIAERQTLLNEQVSHLLKSAPQPPPPALFQPTDQTHPSGLSNPFESLTRANYTTTALHLFTLPLLGVRTAGASQDQVCESSMKSSSDRISKPRWLTRAWITNAQMVHVDAAARASLEALGSRSPVGLRPADVGPRTMTSTVAGACSDDAYSTDASSYMASTSASCVERADVMSCEESLHHVPTVPTMPPNLAPVEEQTERLGALGKDE